MRGGCGRFPGRPGGGKMRRRVRGGARCAASTALTPADAWVLLLGVLSAQDRKSVV